MNTPWRLVLIALVSLLLAACATTRPASTVAQPPPVPPQVVTVKALLPVPMDGFWARLRARFAFARCDGDPDVLRWAERYSAHAQRFSAAIKKVLPELRYVAAITDKHAIPAEFVWLPWVESSYRTLPPHGQRAAGLWQLMPRTARSLGLRVDHRYDARLDLHASSVAAMTLLTRYQQTFHDWRLSDMAYNAGMYGIKRLLHDHGPLDGRALPGLKVRRVTRDHLAKLMALSCIVRDPQRFDIELPAIDTSRTLQWVQLDAPLNLHVAARLAGVPLAHLRTLNRANLNARLPVDHLILSQPSAHRFSAAYATLGRLHWRRWQRVQLTAASTLEALVGADAQRRQMLARVNQWHERTKLPRHATVWLPQDVVASLPQSSAVVIASAPLAHRVVSGDTLWDIARRFHVEVGELRSWNHLHGSLLQLGQVLRLTAPR